MSLKRSRKFFGLVMMTPMTITIGAFFSPTSKYLSSLSRPSTPPSPTSLPSPPQSDTINPSNPLAQPSMPQQQFENYEADQQQQQQQQQVTSFSQASNTYAGANIATDHGEIQKYEDGDNDLFEDLWNMENSENGAMDTMDLQENRVFFEAPTENKEAFLHNDAEEEEEDYDDDDEGCYIENHPTLDNILGTSLRPCGDRNFCTQCNEVGNNPQSLCCTMTPDFLESPHGSYLTKLGIQEGETACLSLNEWLRANKDGVAPPVWLESSLGGEDMRVSMERAGITAEFFFSYALDLEGALNRLHEFRAKQAIFRIMSLRQKDDTNES